MCADHNRYPFPPIHTPDHPTEFKWGGKRVGFEEVVQVFKFCMPQREIETSFPRTERRNNRG